VEKLDKAKLRQQLTPLQYDVCINKGTERPFTGEYWNNHDPGVYVCAVCGRDLFASDTKYDSGTGWPSFWAPIRKESVDEKEDRSLFMRRLRSSAPTAGPTWGMCSTMVRGRRVFDTVSIRPLSSSVAAEPASRHRGATCAARPGLILK